MTVENHGCRIVDLDMQKHIINLDGPEEAVDACARAIADRVDAKRGFVSFGSLELDAGAVLSSSLGFSIGYVSLQTGLSTHVIRAWERRYQAVMPQRSASRRRVFTQTEIDRLILLKQLLNRGHSISAIAGLDHERLVHMAGIHHAGGTEAHEPANTVNNRDPALHPAEWVDECLKAVQNLDGAVLHRCLQRATLTFSRQTLLDRVIKPLMDQIGRRWSEGSLRIVHGHLASAIVHAQLNCMLDHRLDLSSQRPRILVATPVGQSCYLGALTVAVIAQDHGWKAVFLGHNLPAEEIAMACARLAPQLIALSITCRVDDGFMHSELKRLSEFIAARCPLVIGGRASHVFRRCIEALGGAMLESTQDLINRLH